MFQDLRYALRTFARSPALVAAAVVCLALGIGANATIFGVVDTLLFRAPPHVQDPDRVVRLYFRHHSPSFGTYTSSITSYPLYKLISDSARAFDAVAAFTYSQNVSLGRGTDARRVAVVLATASYFPLLGVRPALGRFYAADEDRLGGPAVAVLSYEFWRGAFGGDSGILGQRLQIGRSSYEVVGVAPERFSGVNLQNVDVWVPLAVATPELMGGDYLNRGSFFVQLIGRVGAGGKGAAEREATVVLRAEDAQYAAQFRQSHDSNPVALLGPVQPARGPEISQNAKVSLWLAAVSVIVLLVACANVANLLLARSLQRQREVAIRLALGAEPSTIRRMVMRQGLTMALVGCVVGVVGAQLGAGLLTKFMYETRASDPVTLGAVVTAVLGVALLACAIPGWRASGEDPTRALRAE